MKKALKVVLIVLAVAIAGVLALAATKPDNFSVQRSATIKAPPERISGVLSDFRGWQAWSPFEKMDPAMKRSFSGAEKGKGAVYAWSGNGEEQELRRTFAMADAAWERAGRSHKPYRMGGFWYTLADNGQQKLYDYVYEYLAIAGADIATMMAQSVHRSTSDAVLAALDNAEAAGCEELFMVPATAELREIERLLELLSRR